MRQGKSFTFIKNSSSPVIVMHMAQDKAPHTEEQQTKPRRLRPWRPTRRQVLWAVGTLFTLVTIALLVALLVVNLDAVKWEDLSRERREQVALFIGIAVALTTLFVLLAIGGASLGWTGFGDKTVWDWLQLLSALAIPVVLAAAGLWFTAQQDARQQNVEDERAKAERKLAEQRAQDEALQAYLNQIGTLLLEKDLRKAQQDSEVRTLARARTLTVLERLDPSRKTAVMQFLNEAQLIQSVEGSKPIITLSGANLSGAILLHVNLSGTKLLRADLSGANLNYANLSDADLSRTDLSEANLRQADLSNANLGNANLSGAMLLKADLSEAHLVNANLSRAYLRRADLSRAFPFRADLSEANLHYADLSRAYLSEAVLSGTYLSHANLFHANLSEPYSSEANLSGANLSEANLYRARGITKEQLEKQTSTLEGATMPDGTVVFSAEFEPALSFSLSEEWYEEEWQVFWAEESPDFISRYVPEGGSLDFTNPLHVFDPSDPSAPKELRAPENAEEWLSWFQRHPNLDTSKPVPASVGDASGKRIDVTVTSTPENYPRSLCIGQPCVPLYPLTSESREGTAWIAVDEGYKHRFVIVDVQGETVLIDAAAPTDKSDEFLPKAQKVLDSVEWKGG
jgi:uncharacterized protein YjbI with pentapeptide repeats